MNKFWIILLTITFSSFFSTSAFSQQDLRIRVTNLEQDVNAMNRLLKSIKIDFEQIDRQQKTLNDNMKVLQSALQDMQSKQSTKEIELESQIQDVLHSYQAEDTRNRQEILKDVYARIETLAKQTQSSIDVLARSINASSAASSPSTTFSDDFPQTGISYVVKSGDSLSKIAKANNSQVKWIQDANRISDPRSLQVGKTIFVPQQ